MSTDLNDFLVYLQQHKQLIDQFLHKILPHPAPNQQLYAAMRYSVLNQGKRLRPILVYATGEVLGINIQNLHAAAMAVELVHCYSLIHDDLPAMDDDDLRRGQPSCHKAYDEATAILAGDALLPLAFEVIGDADLNPVTASQKVSMVQTLAKAIGGSGMVLGQALDMAAERTPVSLDDLSIIHTNKTGALFNACIELAMLAAPTELDQLIKDNLRIFGKHLGLAFQIQDDILDVTGTTEQIGKPAGSDQHHSKSTFVSLLGLAGAQQALAENYNHAVTAAQNLGHNQNTLIKLANHLITRTY